MDAMDAVFLRQRQDQIEKGKYRIYKHINQIDRLSRLLGQKIPKKPCYRTSRVKIIKKGVCRA